MYEDTLTPRINGVVESCTLGLASTVLWIDLACTVGQPLITRMLQKHLEPVCCKKRQK